jgi:hypothetical protein
MELFDRARETSTLKVRRPEEIAFIPKSSGFHRHSDKHATGKTRKRNVRSKF